MHNGIRPRIGPWLFYIQYRPTRLWWPVMASALGGETSICFCHATVREGKARPQRVPLLARAHAPSQQPHGTPSHRVQTDRETGPKTACSPMSLDHHGHRADLATRLAGSFYLTVFPAGSICFLILRRRVRLTAAHLRRGPF